MISLLGYEFLGDVLVGVFAFAIGYWYRGDQE